MKIYSCESNYITIPDAARLLLTKLGFDKDDEKNLRKIYRIIRRLEEEGLLKTEKLNERMNKIKRSEMKNLVQTISKHFEDKKEIKKKNNKKEMVTKETQTSYNYNYEDRNTFIEVKDTASYSEVNPNLEFIKGLLEGKFDHLLNQEEKKKLLKELINEGQANS